MGEYQGIIIIITGAFFALNVIFNTIALYFPGTRKMFWALKSNVVDRSKELQKDNLAWVTMVMGNVFLMIMLFFNFAIYRGMYEDQFPDVDLTLDANKNKKPAGLSSFNGLHFYVNAAVCWVYLWCSWGFLLIVTRSQFVKLSRTWFLSSLF